MLEVDKNLGKVRKFQYSYTYLSRNINDQNDRTGNSSVKKRIANLFVKVASKGT